MGALDRRTENRDHSVDWESLVLEVGSCRPDQELNVTKAVRHARINARLRAFSGIDAREPGLRSGVREGDGEARLQEPLVLSTV